MIVKGSHTRNSCAYRDYFDGTYTVCCVLREPENDIQFYLINVNFMSYQLFYSHHKLIHEVKVDSLIAVDAGKNRMNLWVDNNNLQYFIRPSPSIIKGNLSTDSLLFCCFCCLPTPMTLASGGSPIFVVHQPASPSICPAVQSLRPGLPTNLGVTTWCEYGCS